MLIVATRKKPEKVKINDSHGDNESSVVRKGTGFVRMSELPPSDDEDEDEEEDDAGQGKGTTAIVTIADTHGDGENSITRKGTGFVRMNELPDSDEEDEDEDEDEDEEEEDHKQNDRGSMHVKIQHNNENAENTIVRKGTGFIHMSELPASDDDDDEDEDKDEQEVSGEEDQKRVRIAADRQDPDEGPMIRKGTGFVRLTDLPPDEEEEDDDDEDQKEDDDHTDGINGKSQKLRVRVADEPARSGMQIKRKGTGFVHVNELPPSDDEDGDEENNEIDKQQEDDEQGQQEFAAPRKKVQLQERIDKKTTAGEPAKLFRKGTGFVHTNELPDSDDEEEEDTEEC